MSAVKTLGQEHVGAMSSLHALAFPPGEQWNGAAFADFLALKTTIALGIEADGGLCAFILLQQVDDEAEILTLCVTPKKRRAGLGLQLVDAATAKLYTLGARRIMLEVGEDNAPAMALYLASGFALEGRRAKYYKRGDRRVDAILMSAHPGGQQAMKKA